MLASLHERSQAIQRAGRIGGFCARHFLALLVTVAAACALWTITYFALLLWAAFADGGLGSPASYPLGLIFVLIAGTLVSITLFLPSTALAEWFAQRRGLPILAQIPISVGVFAFLCFASVCLAAAVSPQRSLRGVAIGFGVLFLVHLVPLGIYWWAAQSGPLLLSVLQRLYSGAQNGRLFSARQRRATPCSCVRCCSTLPRARAARAIGASCTSSMPGSTLPPELHWHETA